MRSEHSHLKRYPVHFNGETLIISNTMDKLIFNDVSLTQIVYTVMGKNQLIP